MFAPCSNGLQWYGVATVLSIISGTWIFLATEENLSKSKIFNPGFPIVSPYIAFVFSFASDNISSSDASGSTKLTSIPKFFKWTLNKLTVPPYKDVTEIIWSPALQRFKTA